MPKLARCLHSRPLMSSPRLWIGSLLVALLSSSTGFLGVALAQVAGTDGSVTGSGPIRVKVATVAGVSRDEMGPVYINLVQCENNVDIEFRLDGAPRNKPLIDVYWGDGCNTDVRNNQSDSSCTYVTTKPGGVAVDARVHVTIQEIIMGSCSDHPQGQYKLWFLPVSQTKSPEMITLYGVNEQVWSDNSPPVAPTNVDAGGGGENVITVTWSADSQTDTDLERFIVYIDRAPSGGQLADAVQGSVDGGTDGTPAINPECPSAYLIPGENPEGLPSQISVKPLDNENQRSYQLKPQTLGLENGVAAVAVRSEDKAGNRSPLSEVTCAKVIPTTNFWETYEQAGGDPDVEGCPCSAVGRTQLESGWPVALSLLLMGASARRRRRGDLPRGRVA